MTTIALFYPFGVKMTEPTENIGPIYRWRVREKKLTDTGLAVMWEPEPAGALMYTAIGCWTLVGDRAFIEWRGKVVARDLDYSAPPGEQMESIQKQLAVASSELLREPTG